MPLLIDGYNLLNVTGIFGAPGRGTDLERSRTALLDFLAAALPPKEVPHTVIVFDATHAPPGLPKSMEHRGISVRFAPRGQEADAVLEDLIEAHPEPRRLVVVSSDHRVQRAARRRKARYIDSDRWYADLKAGADRGAGGEPEPARPDRQLTEEEVAEWMRRFGGPE